jgi:NitT/TauT family transport system substrate-binding protein
VPQDFETMTDLVMNYIARENDERPPVASMMSNRFVGGLRLSDGEWQQAQKSALEFWAYVT